VAYAMAANNPRTRQLTVNKTSRISVNIGNMGVFISAMHVQIVSHTANLA